jgi:NAD(P)-dependent dehydrogenase (short-subunit alcohol dehydrogenase family)
MSKPLAGRIALVTGASRGIGAATAVALAGAGAHVILTARTEGGLTEVDDRIHRLGGTATIAALDLRNADHLDNLAQAVANRWRGLDILVLNAAVLGPLSPVAHISPEDWDQVIAVNLTANWRLVRNFDALLRTSEAGRLVALTSRAAHEPRAYWGAYSASKSALETLLLSYAEEVKEISRVRVALVDPARTRTAMRAAAYPGEDPDTLPDPEVPALAITRLLIDDFETGHRLSLQRS